MRDKAGPDEERECGLDASTVFEKLARFEQSPSIENYLSLRRDAPRIDTQIDRFSQVDPLQYLRPALRLAELSPLLVSGAIDGNDHDIDELCLQLMERLVERKRIAATGRTHLQSRNIGITDALVDHLIMVMLESLQAHGLEPKPSLVVLIRERLGGEQTDIVTGNERSERVSRAVVLGMQMKRKGVQPTIRGIAKIMGVQPSTVTRWFPDGGFHSAIADFEKLFVRFKNAPPRH